MYDVIIIGGGISGNLAAAYLRKKMPDLGIAIVDRSGRARPIVGESLIEVSTSFIREIGLSSYLVEKHFPKYGLTYYYKMNLDVPSDRTYFVDESPTIPPFPSFQINRFTFDRDLAAMNADNNIDFIEGWVTKVKLARGMHALTVEDRSKNRSELTCRWLIDASGRNRVLGRELNVHYRMTEQKDVFWFRLADYDPSILHKVQAIKKENRGFDSHFCTHHFFGKGNWIWCIPMRPEDRRNLISIGITYRTDIYPYRVRTVTDFLEDVSKEHQVVTDLVRSGTVTDTNYYSSYMYESRQRYSPEGWFILGDAADTVDPLYSLGISFISIQVRQIQAIIERDRSDEDVAQFAADADGAYENIHHVATREITRLYQWMHDAYSCHMLMHVSVLASFHLAFPLIINGYLWDPVGARLIRKIGVPEAIERDLRPFRDLVLSIRKRLRTPLPADFVKVQSPFSLNYSYFQYLRDEDLPGSLVEMYFYFVRFRLRLMWKTGWRMAFAHRQWAALVKDLSRALGILLVFRGQRLRDSQAVKWWLGVRGPQAKASTAVSPPLSHQSAVREKL